VSGGARHEKRYPWPDSALQLLRDWWSQGVPTGEIGARLELTKNAVVGKAHRLGLDPRPSPIRPRDPTRPPQIRVHRERVISTLAVPSSVQSAVAEVITPPAPPPRPRTVYTCCWPIGHPGHPGFRFCEAAVEGRVAYCEKHHRRAYAKRSVDAEVVE
jgi:GcrA cell cycle regulator